METSAKRPKKVKIDKLQLVKDLVYILVTAACMLTIIINTFNIKVDTGAVVEEERCFHLVEQGVTYTTGDTTELSVQPKEASKYIVHEYTEEEMEQELYDDSLELLAICVEAEAGNQDFYGKCLVVDVILNRVDSDRFPNDITSVITQDYQFSSLTDGNMDNVLEPSEEKYKAVKSELMDRTDYQVLFFTEGRYNPYCEPMFKYGDHYFGR